eukprot:1152321-Pelagomonas_calceolata.AAC.2
MVGHEPLLMPGGMHLATLQIPFPYCNPGACAHELLFAAAVMNCAVFLCCPLHHGRPMSK